MPRVSKKNKNFDKSEVISEFYENFEKDVMPTLNDFELERRKALAILVVIYAVCLSVMYLCYSKYSWYSNLTIYSMIIGVTVLIGSYFIIVKSFAESLKEACLKNLIKCFGSMSWNTKKSKIHSYDLETSELFSMFNGRSDDDAFVGVYKGVEYKVLETFLYSVQGLGRKAFWPVFDGVVIAFDCNKEIKNKTIVISKGDVNIRNYNLFVFAWIGLLFLASIPALISIIINDDLGQLFYLLSQPNSLILIAVVFIVAFLVAKFCGFKNPEKLKRIRLEDPVFERKYNAYSSDDVEGRYLLTTAFMERFKNLHTAFGSHRAKCSFYDSTVMFSISTTKNLFELGNLFLPVNNYRYVNKFLAEISAIFDLIDYFKLDEKTGL